MASLFITEVEPTEALLALQTDTANLVGLTAAALLAFVFVWAATTKLQDRTSTAIDFASLGLPRPQLLAAVVPIVEILVAGLLIGWPGWGGVAAFGLLILFTTVLIAIIRSGRVASCACFGGSTSRPISARHIIRNGGLLVLAIAATTVSGSIVDLLA